MGKLIEDIKRNPDPRGALLEAVAEEKAYQEYETQKVLENTDVSTLVKVLYDRHVPFSTVFGRYYELEEQGNARMMTVEDARLAGFGGETVDCI